MRNHDDWRVQLSVEERRSFNRIAHELEPELSSSRRWPRRLVGLLLAPRVLLTLTGVGATAMLLSLGRTSVVVPFLCFVVLVIVVDLLAREPSVRTRAGKVVRWASARGEYTVPPPEERTS